MRILDLITKDLLQLTRDWRTIFFMLVMPVAFTLMFGFVFTGSSAETSEDIRLPVAFLDLDNSSLSKTLGDQLASSAVIRLVESENTQEQLEEIIADEDLAAAVIAPERYSHAVQSGEDHPLTVIINRDSTTGIAAHREIQSQAMRLNNAVLSAQVSTEIYAEHAGFNDEDERTAFFEMGVHSSLEKWNKPPVTLESSYTGAVAEASDVNAEVYGDNPFSTASTTMMAQFAVAGIMGSASLLVLERKNGTMQRLMTTQISRAEYLFGHYLTMFLMVLLQLLLLTGFGHLILDVPYYIDPAATIPLIIVSALFSASLGLLIGAIARKEEHVIILSLVLMMVLAGIGGAWVPLELTPESFQQIAYFTPLAWMVDGFKDIVIRGLGIRAILPAIYVLLTFTLALFGLAVWRFRSL